MCKRCILTKSNGLKILKTLDFQKGWKKTKYSVSTESVNVHFDLFLQWPFPRMSGALSSVASALPLSRGGGLVQPGHVAVLRRQLLGQPLALGAGSRTAL